MHFDALVLHAFTVFDLRGMRKSHIPKKRDATRCTYRQDKFYSKADGLVGIYRSRDEKSSGW
jgi:hypothetical protein